ncbi:MAG: NTP transferase domain-containing protein [Anaerolineales bacterium]|nr:NTP transferase domain-containing protein [Anaerolineales bacterium]
MTGKPRIVAIVQARMGASRLPGKVLLDIQGVPMLGRVIQRVIRARTVDDVVIATTVNPGDDSIVRYCQDLDYTWFRGDEEDVLNRYANAAAMSKADIIVRITADCPLMDPELIDRTVEAFLARYPDIDFGSNRGTDRLERTFPIGMDIEVMSNEALNRADVEAKKAHEREHVTPYLYEEPGRFRTMSIDSGGDYGALRWTVDTPEDLEFIREVYARFHGRDDFGWMEVMAILEQEPELMKINSQVQQKTMHDVG